MCRQSSAGTQVISMAPPFTGDTTSLTSSVQNTLMRPSPAEHCSLARELGSDFNHSSQHVAVVRVECLLRFGHLNDC